jgi:hypothetical protein
LAVRLGNLPARSKCDEGNQNQQNSHTPELTIHVLPPFGRDRGPDQRRRGRSDLGHAAVDEELRNLLRKWASGCSLLSLVRKQWLRERLRLLQQAH